MTFASLTMGLLSTALMLNIHSVSAEGFQTKDTPVENTKYKIVKNDLTPVENKASIIVTEINRQVKVGNKVDEKFILDGVTAKDSKGEDLTGKLTYTVAALDKTGLKNVKKIDTSKPAVYTITYVVMDENGASITESSMITVTNEKPELLVEDPEITIRDMDKVVEIGGKVDEKFILDGVKATDLTDGDLTSKITYTLSLVESNKLKPVKKIETSQSGSYIATYAVKNEAGITSTLSSTIKVVGKKDEVETNKLEIAMDYVVKTVNVGESIDEAFILKGVTATDTLDGDLTAKITHTATISENTPKAKTVPAFKIDTSKAGTYTVTYSVENSSGKTASIEGQIEVLEKAADSENSLKFSIQDIGKVVTIGDKVAENYILNGVTATDTVDGDLTSKITYKLFFVEGGTTTKVEKTDFDTSKAGIYTVVYSVQNSLGETASAEGQIQVLDKQPTHNPTLTVKNKNKVVKVGDVIDEKFVMDGVVAQDDKDQDLTDKIMYTVSFSETTIAAQSTDDKLDTSEPGVYTITYVVKNSVGGVATADGKITVEKKTTSSVEKPIEKPTGKPTGKLPSTGEKSSGVVITVFGVILVIAIVIVILLKRRNKSSKSN